MGGKVKLRPKPSPSPSEAALESVVKRAICRMVLGQTSAVRLLLGPFGDTLTPVGLRSTAVAAATKAFGEAYWHVLRLGNRSARLLLRKRAKSLIKELHSAAKESSDLADDVAEAIRTVDEIVAKVGLRIGSASSRATVHTWWDGIFELSRKHKEVASALLRFQDATASADRAAIENAADKWITAVTKRVAFLDTNMRRVLHRYFFGQRAATPAMDKELLTMATALVPPGLGWPWNQALMETGALICNARSPRCDECPLREGCRARAEATSSFMRRWRASAKMAWRRSRLSRGQRRR
jgi:hypothetical protein